ncbi:hypothetical protein L596_000012 [Steinernema carpocapsae]|uniref:Uncharacterized protein n=2 Tax=Steinernema carpocapsae TaxID=34508 RepID=A0A4U8UIY4_STECR|nr:hypothetical protein L596_000009 [Steinernema carpocapsae]TMS32127.1 hypothetical protein L596_000012 [Steinernema carpocapsae]
MFRVGRSQQCYLQCPLGVSNDIHNARSESAMIFTNARSESAMIFTNARSESLLFLRTMPFLRTSFCFFLRTIKLSQLSLLCLCHFEVSNNHHVAHSESAIIFTMPTRSQAMIFTSNNIHKAHSESAMIFTNARSESSLFLRTMPFLRTIFCWFLRTIKLTGMTRSAPLRSG